MTEPTTAADPRCAWHDPGIPQAKLRPRPCVHLPSPEEERAIAAALARVRERVEGLRVAKKKAGRLAESDYFLGFRASRNETVAAVRAIIDEEAASYPASHQPGPPERGAEHG